MDDRACLSNPSRRNSWVCTIVGLIHEELVPHTINLRCGGWGEEGRGAEGAVACFIGTGEALGVS